MILKNLNQKKIMFKGQEFGTLCRS